MKRLVKESLFEKFTEDSDPIADMGIGFTKIVNKLLLDIYGRSEVFEYKIIKDGLVEVFFYPFPVKQIFYHMILKYEEQEQFFVDTRSYELLLYSTSKTHVWDIRQRRFLGGRWGQEEDYKFKDDTIFLSMPKEPKNKEYLDYICECLNKKYGKVQGFSLVEFKGAFDETGKRLDDK